MCFLVVCWFVVCWLVGVFLCGLLVVLGLFVGVLCVCVRRFVCVLVRFCYCWLFSGGGGGVFFLAVKKETSSLVT